MNIQSTQMTAVTPDIYMTVYRYFNEKMTHYARCISDDNCKLLFYHSLESPYQNEIKIDSRIVKI